MVSIQFLIIFKCCCWSQFFAVSSLWMGFPHTCYNSVYFSKFIFNRSTKPQLNNKKDTCFCVSSWIISRASQIPFPDKEKQNDSTWFISFTSIRRRRNSFDDHPWKKKKEKKRPTFQCCPSFQVWQNNLHENSALTGSVHYSKIYNIASEKQTTAFWNQNWWGKINFTKFLQNYKLFTSTQIFP